MEEIRTAEIYVHGQLAGWLDELEKKKTYRFRYKEDYEGPAVSLTMPISQKVYEYASFPPFFDGLLPEGNQLEGLLKQAKLDRNDYFGQLIAVGGDMVGAVTVGEKKEV